MVEDKQVLSILTFSENIYENENDTRNVTLVKGDGKESNAPRKFSLKIRSSENCQKWLGQRSIV